MGAILDAALLIMLACFLPFHLRMVLLNETTIEGPSPEFHVGKWRNWRQVMGKNPKLWLLPVWGGGPDGDGIHWPSPLVVWAAARDGAPVAPPGSRAARAMEEGRLLARDVERSSETSSDGESWSPRSGPQV